MSVERVKSKRTGKRGFRYRYRTLAGTRSYITFWLAERSDAEKAFRAFLDDQEKKKLGIPSQQNWLTRYSDLVKSFIEQAPISSEARRTVLKKHLEKNYLDLKIAADLANVGKLTAACRTEALKHGRNGDEFCRRYVQGTLKQLTAWAASNSLLPYDPLAAWKKLPRSSQPKRRRAFLPAEMRAIVDAAAVIDALFGRGGHSSAMIIKTLLVTGNRPGAIFDAKVSDFTGMRIDLPAARGCKRNGVAMVPEEFARELQEYIQSRKAKPSDPLLVSPKGEPIDSRNIQRCVRRAMVLGCVALAWPAADPAAADVDPMAVADAIFNGKPRGFAGAPPTDDAKKRRREEAVAKINVMVERLKPKVDQILKDKDLYALRATHISWARQLVNADCVKLQVGHAPRDMAEAHYTDLGLLDPSASAAAVWNVLLGRQRLRIESQPAVLAMAAGAESMAYVAAYNEQNKQNGGKKETLAASQGLTVSGVVIGGLDGTRTRDLRRDKPTL